MLFKDGAEDANSVMQNSMNRSKREYCGSGAGFVCKQLAVALPVPLLHVLAVACPSPARAAAGRSVHQDGPFSYKAFQKGTRAQCSRAPAVET